MRGASSAACNLQGSQGACKLGTKLHICIHWKACDVHFPALQQDNFGFAEAPHAQPDQGAQKHT